MEQRDTKGRYKKGLKRSGKDTSGYRHGMARTRPYRIWRKIIDRCCNPREESYKHYGAKGITVSKEWRDDFMVFWADMGATYFEGAEIDRIDNAQGYSKYNCRWATRAEQAKNRRGVTLHNFRGEMLSLHDIAGRTGLTRFKLYYRISKGATIEEATRDGAGENYFQLVKRINELLPNRRTRYELHVEDVLRALRVKSNSMRAGVFAKPIGHIWFISHDGLLMHMSGEVNAEYELTEICFNLTLPLSAPENDAACGAVLELLK